MQKSLFGLTGIVFLVPGMLLGCSSASETSESDPDMAENTENSATNQLELVANGEDFVRQGFVTKDGWQVDFDHVYVTLADVKAYQTDPPFDPEAGKDLEAKETVTLLEEPKTVDLAEGDANADLVAVAEASATEGVYNAISWNVVLAEDEPIEGNTIALIGTATQDSRTVNFNIQIDRELSYTCGEFVGDTRKGIVKADSPAEVETTFHFDHIFGDAEAPADDEINTGAIGFDPLAALAEGDELNVDYATLESELDPETYETLENAIASLGHVGEGHCQ
ncbi:MAG: DUF4382 domain-containing protein [Jaaginema sp. PMC 1079.18]|nr:DUF4382 domain-containing protein [Jaaginema sp. PMC 1080.18]MEC4851416.1 DUF4382 domain-containing protein [Jaaginema sp. PMC 1079.18]MEC4866194.1 DUF4382 domain-containing protein [Jaaginema sp. PMC 1078.18]